MEYSRKSFLGNLLLLVGLNLLIKPFWIFGIEVSVQNLVGTEAYGLYFTLFNLTFIFNMLLDMGTTSFNNRSIARDREALQHYFPRILTLRLLLGGLYALVMLGAGLLTRCTASDFRLLVPLAVNQFLSLLILYLRSNVSGMLMFKTDSLLSVVDRLIMIICCSVLIWGHVTDRPFQISWFVYIQMFSYGVTALFALLVVCRHCRFRRLEWDFHFFRKVLVRSFPFALLALLTNIHNRTDAVLLKWMLPDGVGVVQVGIYASAYRLLDAAVIIGYLFSVILMPLFSHLLSHKENIRGILKTAFVLIFVYGFLLAAVSYFYSFEIMHLYNKHIEASSEVYKYLMISILPLSLTYVFGSLLTANGNLKQLNYIALGAVCVNVACNLLLIPHWQASGSAFSSIITQSFIIICEIMLSVKIFRLHLPAGALLRMTGYGLSCLTVLYFSRILPWSSWGQIGCALPVCLLLVFVFRLVSWRDITSLLKSSKN
jgi:O-antigen/teichoic acid export membrane protein